MGLHLGEGPVWDGAGNRLLLVDCEAGRVLSADLEGDRLAVRRDDTYGEAVGSVVPARDGGIVVAGQRHLHLVAPDGTRTGRIRLIGRSVASRLNDAACDPVGRLLVGSLRQDGRVGEESLWSVAADGGITRLLAGVSVSNGIGFSPDGTEMYHVDSVPGLVRAFAYDVATGTCGAARTVWSGTGIPDGLNVDIQGNLWIAFFGEGEVRCLSPAGTLRAVVEVPVPNPTCAAFVGPHRDRLLITTARRRLTEAQLARWPDAGDVFVVEVGVAGLPATAWAGSTASPLR